MNWKKMFHEAKNECEEKYLDLDGEISEFWEHIREVKELKENISEVKDKLLKEASDKKIFMRATRSKNAASSPARFLRAAKKNKPNTSVYR